MDLSLAVIFRAVSVMAGEPLGISGGTPQNETIYTDVDALPRPSSL